MPRIYIATAQARDAEMGERIKAHQQDRGQGWRTIEEPLDLAGTLRATDGQGVRLVDCLTLWMSNCMGSADIGALTVTLRQQCCPVVLVSNELGRGSCGQRPGPPVPRRSRPDEPGGGGVADQVWMAVSGMPLRLKPMAESPDDPI